MKFNRHFFILTAVLIIFGIFSYFFIVHNESFYKTPIAKITSVTLITRAGETDQEIQAVIMNGTYKGETVSLSSPYTPSQAYNVNYQKGNEVFLSISATNGKISTVQITGFKRDEYLSYIVIIFIIAMLLVGASRGVRSLLSVILNILIFLGVVKLYLIGWNLLAVSAVASLIFIVTSILIVNGRNQKSYSAVIGTVIATGASVLLAGLVFLLTRSNGIHYEMLDYLARPPQQIFLSEIIFGALGGIMDIAITVAAAIKELSDNNPDISEDKLYDSGFIIGEDIMGTMANTLVFAYIGGSIPIILLWLANGVSISYIVSAGISLEIIRALTSSIGIVLSIPICLYVSIKFLHKGGMRQ